MLACVQSILSGLRAVEDEGAQLGALAELNDLLAMCSEDSLAGFPLETTVPLLVQALGAEHSPDIMLMAARALTHLADVFPPSCSVIVRHGAPQALCSRLLAIEYIDLAEQSLACLHKLSGEHAAALLSAGGLLAVSGVDGGGGLTAGQRGAALHRTASRCMHWMHSCGLGA